MERPIFKPIGTPMEELDTPALIIDLDVLEDNISTLHAFFKSNNGAKVRPHVEAHRSPAIAHKQLAAGGTVNGIAVNTVSQAEIFAQNGFNDIFISKEVVTTQKIAHMCALAQNCKITVAVDNIENLKMLSEAAKFNNVSLNTVVDINTGQNLCGVEPGIPSVNMAIEMEKTENVNFTGIMSYEGAILEKNPEQLSKISRKWIQLLLDTRESIEREGIAVGMVSVGGTHNYEIAGALSGVTEVSPGSYALMDYKYRECRPQFRPAAKVMATVMSHPEPQLALLDCGQKAIGSDLGFPVPEDFPNASITSTSAEHGYLVFADGQSEVDLGDKVLLTPLDIGNCINLYDYMNVVRNGKLNLVWEVSARGRYR